MKIPKLATFVGDAEESVEVLLPYEDGKVVMVEQDEVPGYPAVPVRAY